MAYEAGFGGIGDGSETDLAIQASLDPRMGPVYTAYLSMLEEEGVSLIAHYTSVGQYSRYGSFALKIASDQVRVGHHFPASRLGDKGRPSRAVFFWKGCCFDDGCWILFPTLEGSHSMSCAGAQFGGNGLPWSPCTCMHVWTCVC